MIVLKNNLSILSLIFRKKLSIFSAHHDWDHSSNYIAKRYIEDVPMARYFDDVMMQMTTKLWATHYNKHNPPKKVDIVQMSVLEFQDRPGRPYYHLERYIVKLRILKSLSIFMNILGWKLY